MGRQKWGGKGVLLVDPSWGPMSHKSSCISISLGVGMPGLHPHSKWTDVPRILPVCPFLGHTGTLRPRDRRQLSHKVA